MKTYLRYSLVPTDNPFSGSKVPDNTKREAELLFEKCRKYCKNEYLRLLLIPVDSPEYAEVSDYISRHYDWAARLVMYEHKFTVKEVSEAEFFLLQSRTVICPENTPSSLFSKCCQKGRLCGGQKGYFRIKKRQMEGRILAGSSTYRYFISRQCRDSLTAAGITNIRFLPVYDSKEESVLAYQPEAEKLLPPLAELNSWTEYKKCDFCGHKVYDGVHNYPHPFFIPGSIKSQLYDFNATSETFSETDARYCIISRKMYSLLVGMGAKNLTCQPIVFIDGK